jgi:hypothetical protein
MRMRILFNFIFLLCCCYSCALFAQSKAKIDTVKQNEEYKPFSLGDYDIEIPLVVNQDENALNIDEILKGQEQDTTEVREKVMPGFRVQLVATRDEDEARNVRREAVLTFSEKVYLSFDDPYYKVRIGDCISRFDANDLQEQAISKGFFEAWVVRTNIHYYPGEEGIK